MKIRPVGAELIHADKQTDTTKLIVVFGKFTRAPKNAAFRLHSVFLLRLAIFYSSTDVLGLGLLKLRFS